MTKNNINLKKNQKKHVVLKNSYVINIELLLDLIQE